MHCIAINELMHAVQTSFNEDICWINLIQKCIHSSVLTTPAMHRCDDSLSQFVADAGRGGRKRDRDERVITNEKEMAAATAKINSCATAGH